VASPLKSARDTIASRWEAATPPTDPTVLYRRAAGLERTGSLITRRRFYFADPKRLHQTEWGSSFSVYKYSFDAVVIMTTAGRTSDQLIDDILDEGALLSGLINLFIGWPAGVRYVLAERSRVELADSGDLELILECVAECEESDGA
jgi:hypothetical protein